MDVQLGRGRSSVVQPGRKGRLGDRAPEDRFSAYTPPMGRAKHAARPRPGRQLALEAMLHRAFFVQAGKVNAMDRLPTNESSNPEIDLHNRRETVEAGLD